MKVRIRDIRKRQTAKAENPRRVSREAMVVALKARAKAPRPTTRQALIDAGYLREAN